MAKKKRSLTDRVNIEESVTMTAEAQEKALEQLKGGVEPKKKKRVRVSVDFPPELYERMKIEAERRGQTHRGFILSLVKGYYEE